MQLIFIDDSGQERPRRDHLGELVSVGAVMFPEDQMVVYSRAIDELRSEIGMPDGEEFKWKPSKGSWLANAGGEVVKGARRRMLEIAGQCGVRTAVVIWDRGRADWDKKEVATTILGYLYERIERELQTTDERGVVIADVPGGGSKDHAKWLSEALDLTTVGTAYVKPDRVVMPIVTAPSDHVPHLQLADLVTAATTAAIAGLPNGLELVELLKPLARRNAYGRIGGSGLALVPRDPLIDLYFWVLGETDYYKNGIAYAIGPTDSPFSQPGRLFQNHDGLPTPESKGPGSV
ncbi:DUF3800 domain-containing protein [Streptomyces sp. HNM0663]|uniref:DUF3800 domain-containing protein n=1 Tax=Streptomyces chengmaiensis TaxID=3040919 RepID=A0ABT6HIJ4_9ACTN|nr:DUF3800 domain-containing protein [Streptomyces chengmaiensis]MDH2388567.1 DUF3800 domain-containing protein [Streptomyces chengmaiensis]